MLHRPQLKDARYLKERKQKEVGIILYKRKGYAREMNNIYKNAMKKKIEKRKGKTHFYAHMNSLIKDIFHDRYAI